MNAEMQNAPTGGRSACVNFAGFARKRIAASRRMEPLDCGCRDPWTCPNRRGRVTAEGTRAAAQHLAGHGLTGRFLLHHLRDAWHDADPATRALIEEIAGD